MRRALTILLAMLAAWAPAVAMADEVRGVDVQQLERELRCPTCNAPLAVSNSPAADQIKAEIRRRAAAGQSEEQIKDALVKDFGREVLATPPKEGFDLVAWIVPSIVVLIGLVSIPFITRRWSRRSRRGEGDRAPSEAPRATSEEMERLDEALRARDT